ncbi:MAG: DUF4261 domain-containing protein [Sutterella sp.]|nr:DUF4261 domain-containing protein [Sutterella sp.]
MTDTEKTAALPVEGHVLTASAEWSPEAFAAEMKTEWEIDVPASEFPKSADDALVFEAEGAVVAVKAFDEPLPAEMMKMHASLNPLWPQAGAIAQLHRAHLACAVIPKTCGTVESASLLVKILSSLTRQPSALAVDNGSTVIGPEGYREGASVMKAGELPLFNLVTFAIARTEGGKLLGCTMGLSLLGHRELEIEPCEAAPEVVQEFLYTVASWALKTGRDVKPGDLLGLDPQNRHPVVLAPSSVIPGLETLRITLI